MPAEVRVQSASRRTLLLSTLPTALAALSLSQPAGAGSGEVVLVVGATSTTGQDLCKDLLAMGYRVRGLTRRAEDVKKAVV
jgi:NADPH:quinone reductase-like Zn-dependent oxidoreductase